LSQFEGYTIIEHLGHGAMGSVEKIQVPDGRILALKTLSPHLAQEGDYVKRFKREAEIALQLSHPNVVKVIEVGEDAKGLPFIIMEYVDGKTLDEIMHDRGMASADSEITLIDDHDKTIQSSVVQKRSSNSNANTFTPAETIRLGRQLAGVLQSAYDLHLLHRDIKPQNIMIDKRGNAKILDFGIAKDLEGVYSALSLTGQAIGTPAYMSPEQYVGAKDIDIRSDLYSLGCTMYHMLTGRPPFRGASITALINLHLNTYADPVNKLNTDCPLNLSQVIDRLLAKKPEDRHKSPAELIEDLNRVERGEVPLKLHKIKKSKEHNPLKTWIYVAVVIIILSTGFAFFSSYRSKRARIMVENGISDARQLSVKHEYDKAKKKLDQIITENADEHPVLVEKAKKLRFEIINKQAAYINIESEYKRKIALARQRKSEEGRLARQNAERISRMYECTRLALRAAQSKNTIKDAEKHLAEAFRLCMNNTERQKVISAEKTVKDMIKRYIQEAFQQAEIERKRKVEAERLAQQNAERISKLSDAIRYALQSARTKETIKDSNKYLDQAYDLCNNNAERQKVSAAEKTVTDALNKFKQEALKQAEIERKRKAEAEKLAQQNAERISKLSDAIRRALQSARTKETIKDSNKYLEQAYGLCNNDAERQKVHAAEKTVTEAIKQFQQAEIGRKRKATAEKLAQKNAERKNKIDELTRQAMRLARNKDTIKDSNKYLDQAYKLCTTNAEKQKVSAAEKNISDAEMQFQQAALMKAEKKHKPVAMKVPPKAGNAWEIPGLNMKLAYLKAGSFMMGSKNGDPDEKPMHKVILSQGLWMGIHEVTQQEYQAIMSKNPSKRINSNLPVEQVTWNNAVDFCKRLTERESKAGRLPTSFAYRLPTEAEWEYAARGTTRTQYSGSNKIGHVAWYYANSHQKPREVGTKKPNDFGLYDMTGNVWEWCLDHCDVNANREVITTTYKDAIKNPLSTKGQYRINRGGSWSSLTKNCRVTNRRHKLPNTTSPLLGFRVALAPVE
jgi:serine/threonine protein kinase/formylglycine-generating enzyme required for sulfatase activity